MRDITKLQIGSYIYELKADRLLTCADGTTWIVFPLQMDILKKTPSTTFVTYQMASKEGSNFTNLQLDAQLPLVDWENLVVPVGNLLGCTL